MTYQKCVRSISIEEDKWRKQGGRIVVVQFSRPIHRFVPRYSELKRIIKLLIKLYGKEEVIKNLK